MTSMIATLEIVRFVAAIALCVALFALAVYGLYRNIKETAETALQNLWSRSRYRRKESGKVSEGMFIAAIIGATIVILTVFYAVMLFIACIIDQHKREQKRSSCDDDDSHDEKSDGRV